MPPRLRNDGFGRKLGRKGATLAIDLISPHGPVAGVWPELAVQWTAARAHQGHPSWWTECWIFAMSVHGRDWRQWSMTLARPNGARLVVIWVYGADGAEEMAFTDVGKVNLIE